MSQFVAGAAAGAAGAAEMDDHQTTHAAHATQIQALPPPTLPTATTTGASKSDGEENEEGGGGGADDSDAGSSGTDVGSEVGSDSECDEEQALHPNYYDWEQIYGDVPELRALRDAHGVVRAELERLEDPALFNWPEQNLYDGVGEQWKVLPFLHTFPGNDASKSVWMDRFCAMCPETVKLLRAVPGIHTALLSRMGPQTRLSAHRGWADLANHVLRLHLGLRIPHTRTRKVGDVGAAAGAAGGGDAVASDDHTCGLWVRGEKRYHREGEIICFDDSKLHKAFNNHPTENRSVLIFDLVRPSHLPMGSAQKGHTDALDGFIAYFR